MLPRWRAAEPQSREAIAALWLWLRSASLEDLDGMMRNSAIYIPALDRYVMVSNHTARNLGNIAIWEAPEPWGPWNLVMKEWGWPSAETDTVSATFAFGNFSSKWSSADGHDFVFVWFRPDSWNSVPGQFITTSGPPPALPDLVVQGESLTPDSPVSGGIIAFTADIVNGGSASAGGLSSTRLYVDGTPVPPDQATGDLAPGAFETESWSWTATAGDHDYRICADDDGAGGVIGESSETNNCGAVISFTVSPLPSPDLVVDNEGMTPSSPAPGETVSFTAHVVNNGSAATGASSGTRLYVDDAPVPPDQTTGDLAPGAFETETWSWTATEGHHDYRICADDNGAGGVIDESEETNNCTARIPFSVGTSTLKGMQNGSASLPGGSSSITVPITGVDPSRSFLVFSAHTSDAVPTCTNITGQLTDPTTLTFARGDDCPGTDVTIEWYVAEFASGVAVQRGSANVGSGNTVIPISAVDMGKSFVMMTERPLSGATMDADDFHRAKILDSTTLEITARNATSNDRIAEWQVVEYAAASVQSGDIAVGSSESWKTVTIATVDPSRAWLMFTYSSDTGSGSNIGQKMIRGLVSDPTSLVFDRANTGQEMDLTWYLVEFTDDTRVQHGSANLGIGETQKDVTVADIDPGRAMATAGGYDYRGGKTPYSSNDDPGVASVTLDLIGSGVLRLIRSIAATSADIGWFVVEF